MGYKRNYALTIEGVGVLAKAKRRSKRKVTVKKRIYWEGPGPKI